jgi:glycerate kinase
MRQIQSVNALGEKIDASYGTLAATKTAIIEMAKASGLALLNSKTLKPLEASSYGTGLLIKDAIAEGYTNIILGIGGSATTDGGAGIAAALGVKFFNQSDESFVPTGATLDQIKVIEVKEATALLKDCQIKIACDVENPLIGKHGAAEVFAPQKGATPEQVQLLEKNLQHYSLVIKEDFNKDVSIIKHGGAAGGIAAGLFGLLDATLVNGTDLVMTELGIKDKLMQCDIVITAEGKLDSQTLDGKGPYGIALLAKEKGKIVIGIGGSIPAEEIDKFTAFDAMFALPNEPMSLENAMKNGETLLSQLAQNIGTLIQAVSHRYYH